MSVCFLFGQRDTDEAQKDAIYQAILHHIEEYHVTEFIVGQYGAFDRIALSCIQESKHFYPQIKLCILLPYHPSIRPPTLPEGVDTTWHPSNSERVPPRAAIVHANRCAVLRADHIITYAPYVGNAHALAEYAQRKGHATIYRIEDTP